MLMPLDSLRPLTYRYDLIRKIIVLLTVATTVSLVPASPLCAGPYSNSAHGNSSYGVKRNTASHTDFVRGNCAHCHEMKASIDDSEPDPVGGAPSPSAVFYDNNVSQTDNFCLECHGVPTLQSGGITNRSYSYRAGAWTSDTVNDVEESFAFSSPNSSHNLNDILEFIKTKTWGYRATSNPCVACHNPHAAQGDPPNPSGSTKSAGTRGNPISLPSLHSAGSGSWGLWGDVASETMSTYNTYQAPYRYNSAVNFEPQGDTVAATAAANTTDFATFCTDCHNATNTIYSTAMGRNLYKIDWTKEMHGKGIATNPLPARLFTADPSPYLHPPYADASIGTYVLSCLDCHEPHGSSNRYLLRKEVNGAAGVVVTTELESASPAPGPGAHPANKEWVYLCGKCHNGLLDGDGHIHPEVALPDVNPPTTCSSAACHYTDGGYDYNAFFCGNCHYHSKTDFTDPTKYMF